MPFGKGISLAIPLYPVAVPFCRKSCDTIFGPYFNGNASEVASLTFCVCRCVTVHCLYGGRFSLAYNCLICAVACGDSSASFRCCWGSKATTVGSRWYWNGTCCTVCALQQQSLFGTSTAS
jgi:hypothetical protein